MMTEYVSYDCTTAHTSDRIKCEVHTAYTSAVNNRFWSIEFRFSEDGKLLAAVGRLEKDLRNGYRY